MGNFSYYLFQFLIILILGMTMGSVYLCRNRCKNLNFTKFVYFSLIMVIPPLWYIIQCPVYNGLILTQLSDNRTPIYNSKVRPWGDTFVCKFKQIYYPKHVDDIQSIVLNSTKIRVVGSGHSFSPVVCTNETLISLENMKNIISVTNNYVTCEAGSTIEELQYHLLKYDKIIHGFGSIQDQTLAGAFSTSHHGLTFNSFGEDVISLTAVLSNGTIINTTDLFFWRSHLGMMGIITSLTIKLYPNMLVNIEVKKLPLKEAIDTLPMANAGIIETNFNQKTHGLLKFITTSLPSQKEYYPVKTDHFQSALWDTLLIPLLVIFPIVSELKRKMRLFCITFLEIKGPTSAYTHLACW